MNNPEKSSEPTMEDILASIRRIIADEDAAARTEARPTKNFIVDRIAQQISVDVKNDVRRAIIQSLDKKLASEKTMNAINEEFVKNAIRELLPEIEALKLNLFTDKKELEIIKVALEGAAEGLAKLSTRVDERSRDIDHQNTVLSDLKRELHAFMLESQMGLRSRDRYFPMYVYLADTQDSFVVADKLRQMVGAFNFDITDEYEAVRGSWFKKWIAKYVDKDDADDLSAQFSKMTRALNWQRFTKHNPELTKCKRKLWPHWLRHSRASEWLFAKSDLFCL